MIGNSKRLSKNSIFNHPKSFVRAQKSARCVAGALTGNFYAIANFY